MPMPLFIGVTMELDRYEEREKNKNTLKFRITFFFVFFLVAVFVVFILTSVLQSNTVTRYVCSQLALPTVRKALAEINPESFERFAESMDPSDGYYIITQQRLHQIKQETNCLYLYTMAPLDGTVFRYIIDGSGPPGSEGFSEPGTEEDLSYWDKAALDTVYTKTGQLGTLTQLEEWGATISAYEPILKENGELVGIVACDIDATDVISWIKTQVLWQLGIVLLLLVVGLTVYITLIKKVNQAFA
jgi:sensor histidine kinase regulating citrate/malate metabolism